LASSKQQTSWNAATSDQKHGAVIKNTACQEKHPATKETCHACLSQQYTRMDDFDDDQINAQHQQMAEQKIKGSTTAFDGYKLWILEISAWAWGNQASGSWSNTMLPTSKVQGCVARGSRNENTAKVKASQRMDQT
jgi:hypothetical protein